MFILYAITTLITLSLSLMLARDVDECFGRDYRTEFYAIIGMLFITGPFAYGLLLATALLFIPGYLIYCIGVVFYRLCTGYYKKKEENS